MSKLNIRKHSNFISTVSKFDKKQTLDSNFEARERIQNIAWPSECMVDLGSIPIGECKRTMFYKILGVKATEPMKPKGKAVCDAGNMYEAYYIKKFKDLGIFEDEQVPISYIMPDTSNRVAVSGRMDCIVKEGGKKKGIEIKSVSAWKAPKVMGDKRTTPVPAANNLMQAMLYTYYLSNTDAGKALDVDEVYLLYVNRSDNSTFYFRVDLDEQGYAIITAIDSLGNEVYTVETQGVPSYEDLLTSSEQATDEQSRFADVRINIYDIFKKFDAVYNYSTNKMLPPCDYTLVYNQEQIEREFKLGRMSKVKYNKAKKGETYGDFKCEYCDYRTKCLADSGITLT